AVRRLVAAVAAVMRDLIVSAVLFYQDVSIDKSFVIFGSVSYDRTVLGIDEIEVAVAAFDPVVSGDKPRRTVFQIVAIRARAKRAEAVVLERDAKRGAVIIMLERAAGVAVAIDVIAFHENVPRRRFVRRTDEKPVSAIGNNAISDRQILGLFNIDRSRVLGVVLRLAVRPRKLICLKRAAYFQV